MAENASHSFITNVDQYTIPTLRNVTIQLPADHAKRYELKDPRFFKAPNHLCLYCDLFFQHVQKAFVYPSAPESAQAAPESAQAIKSIQNEHIYPHWPKFFQLKIAAEHGCHICKLFLSRLTTEEQKSLMNFEQTNRQHGLIYLLFLGQLHDIEHPQVRIRFAASPDLQNSQDSAEITSTLTMDRADDYLCEFGNEDRAIVDSRLAIWELAFSWITNCVVNHSGCRKLFMSSKGRPRRLIEVGENNNETRLCRASKLGPEVSYVTLSHCWGTENLPYKLLKANKLSLYERIPMAELSRTFTDAIEFTRRLRLLGVKYLWIDALCILQDSEEDWQDQALVMGEIYGNAFLNLAACTGSDGTFGLYPEHDGESRHICNIKAGASSCISGSFTVRNNDIMGNNHLKNTILSRGWCVQELALAPRVLYFGRGRTAWNCPTLLAEDIYPTREIELRDRLEFSGRIFKQSLYKDFPHPSAAPSTEFKIDTNEISIFAYYRAWMNIIKEYTCCDLTRHTDRLIAVSGIARLIHARIRQYPGIGHNEKYVAGLWKNYLPFHLVWCVNGRSQSVNYQLRPYRAPSWSWASVDSKDVYNHLTGAEAVSGCVPFIQVFEDIKLENEINPFGSVKKAVLYAQGPVFKGFLGPRLGHSRRLCKLFAHAGGDGSKDDEFECNTNPGFVNLDFSYPGSERVPVYVLIVMPSALEGHLACLILVRQNELSTRGCYIRIGVTYDVQSDVLPLARKLWRLQEQGEYDEEVDDGGYKISII